MSRTARRVPRTLPVTFDDLPSAVDTRPPPRSRAIPGRPRPAPSRAATGAAVAQSQLQQRLAPGGPHRSEVGQRDRRSGGAARARAGGLRRARATARRRARPRARRGRDRPRRRPPGPRPAELPRVERSVAVHEAHHVRRRCLQPGEARRAEPAPRLAHDARPVPAGHVGGAVGEPLSTTSGRTRRESGRARPGARRLVEHGEDHLDHSPQATRPALHIAIRMRRTHCRRTSHR